MKKQPLQSVTSLPPSPDEERRGRAIKYTITMSVRVACFLLIFVVPGWWRIIPVIGTIVLPYIAVVIANTATRSAVARPERPGSIVRVSHPDSRGPRDES